MVVKELSSNLSEARSPLSVSVPALASRIDELISRIRKVYNVLDGNLLLEESEVKESKIVGVTKQVNAAHQALTILENWVCGLEDVVGL